MKYQGFLPLGGSLLAAVALSAAFALAGCSGQTATQTLESALELDAAGMSCYQALQGVSGAVAVNGVVTTNAGCLATAVDLLSIEQAASSAQPVALVPATVPTPAPAVVTPAPAAK
jgi:hypothetical protein